MLQRISTDYGRVDPGEPCRECHRRGACYETRCLPQLRTRRCVVYQMRVILAVDFGATTWQEWHRGFVEIWSVAMQSLKERLYEPLS
jgi:hypothetical protein